MSGLEHAVACLADQPTLLFGKTAPQHKDDVGGAVGQVLDGGVREDLPVTQPVVAANADQNSTSR